MSISDLLTSSAAVRRGTFGVLEALTIHLILSCTWFCNGTLEPYSTKELPVNVDYNIYVIYADPYNASSREPSKSDLDPQCLNVNSMNYMGLSNACYKSDLLCSQLESLHFMHEEHHSRKAEATPKSSEIGYILKRIREELSESQKTDAINLYCSSFPLPMLVDAKPHLLDWGSGYLHSHKVAFLTLTNRQKDTVFHAFKHSSNDNQFYVCNYSGSLLDAGGRNSICLVYHPKRLGLSSAHLVIQTNCSGFLIHGKGFAVNHPIEDETIEMEKIAFIGLCSKSISLFSSISLTVYAMEFKSSILSIMHSLFKKVLRRLSMEKIYGVTFFVVSLMFLRHWSTTPHIMQRYSRAYSCLGGNNLMQTDGPVGKSTSMHRSQEVSGDSIFHKMNFNHNLKKNSRSMAMDCNDNAEQCVIGPTESVVSLCVKLEPVNIITSSVDNISRENNKQESAASSVMKSAVILNAKIEDSANISTIAVKVGKQKRKKRRGKGPRAGAVVSIDSPGSQSGYSTPPTPMSPVTTVLLPNQNICCAKSEKHKHPRSPIKTNGVKLSMPKKVFPDAPEQTFSEPVSGSSSIFPDVGYPAQYLHRPHLLHPSAIAPHARAPGPKLCKTSEKVALVKEEAVNDFTYNLWGNSFFGVDRRPKEASVISLGNDSDPFSFFVEGPALLENYHSGYVRPYDPKGMLAAESKCFRYILDS